MTTTTSKMPIVGQTVRMIVADAEGASLARVDALHAKLDRLRKLTAGRDRDAVIAGMMALRATRARKQSTLDLLTDLIDRAEGVA